MSALTLHEQLAVECLARKQSVPAVSVQALLDLVAQARNELIAMGSERNALMAERNALRDRLTLIALATVPKASG
jgi:hypothetical protein